MAWPLTVGLALSSSLRALTRHPPVSRRVLRVIRACVGATLSCQRGHVQSGYGLGFQSLMPLDAALQWVIRFVDTLIDVFVFTVFFEFFVQVRNYVVDDGFRLLGKLAILAFRVPLVAESDSKGQLIKGILQVRVRTSE